MYPLYTLRTVGGMYPEYTLRYGRYPALVYPEVWEVSHPGIP